MRKVSDENELEWIEPPAEDSTFTYPIRVTETGELCLRQHKEYFYWEEKYTDGSWKPAEVVNIDPPHIDWNLPKTVELQPIIDKFKRINERRNHLLTKLKDNGKNETNEPFLFGLIMGKIEAMESVIDDLEDMV